MGDICSFQKDFSEALNKYNLSAEYFKKAGKTIDASYSILNIGRTYRLTKNYNKASVYYRKVFNKMSDSIFNGLLIQEMGINYYSAKQYDSAQYYLRKSICFPYKSTNFSIRCFILADLYFDIERYDSASFYALKSLKYPANFLTQRECYRLLANAEFVNGNFRQMAKYMTYFQACSDSVRKIESQTKVTVLEELHLTTASASKRKQYVYILSWLIPLIILVSLLIFYRLKIRNKGKEKELKEAEVQIIYKQNLLFDALIQKINEYKNSQSAIYKKSTLQQKEILDKELYNQCLHVNDWNLFKKLMDKTLNNIVSFLEKNYPEITHKEITFCCLILLDIPTPDIALILESQPGTLYKMKSRLTQKMKLKSNKDLDALLKRKSEGK
jgi:tetratricopeptide (TPR) repeat protein